MQRGCSCLGSTFAMLIFFVVGIGLAYWGWGVLQNARASAGWPAVSGQITSSSVSHSTDSEGADSYTPSVGYRYVVNDQQYTGSRIKFGETSYNKESEADAVVARYPAGTTVPIYYNPADPATAVLEPGVTSGSYVFLAVGACFIVLSLVLTPIMAISSLRRK